MRPAQKLRPEDSRNAKSDFTHTRRTYRYSASGVQPRNGAGFGWKQVEAGWQQAIDFAGFRCFHWEGRLEAVKARPYPFEGQAGPGRSLPAVAVRPS